MQQHIQCTCLQNSILWNEIYGQSRYYGYIDIGSYYNIYGIYNKNIKTSFYYTEQNIAEHDIYLAFNSYIFIAIQLQIQ